jgi:gliding motility-associated-like protein
MDTIQVKFTDLSTTYAPTTIRNWNWSFGDGNTSTVQSPTHVFRKPGKYFITLTVTNNEGCTSLPLIKQLIVYGSPKAAFVMPKQICLTDSIPFVNTSTLGYGSTKFISYTWDFGDGIPLNYTANPTHRFKFAGTFGVRLTVRADSSCMTSTFIDSVTVIGYPKAKFGIANYCVETPIFFKDSSLAGYADKVGSWRWNFGDNSFSSLTSPVHIYKNIGIFPVQLIVSGTLCPSMQDSITVPLKIIDRRRDSVYAIKYLQYNVAQSLCALPGGDKYTWSPSTDINPIDSRCVTINVQHPKTTYKITIIDSAGCTINDRQEIWGFPGTDIFLPRAFIPASSNRDNAIFKPIYVGVTAIKYFKIYDRFGHEVFTTSDMSKYWDGTSNGVNQPMETYTWIIQGFDYNNKPVIRQGNVTLIRYQ